MYRRSKAPQNQAVRRGATERGRRTIFSVTMLILLMIVTLIGLRLFGSAPTEPTQRIIPIPEPGEPGEPGDLDNAAAPTVGSVARATPDPSQPLIGIVSGHRGYDPGAICDDGLSEADVNYAIALEVVDLLQRRGLRVDLLNEFDDRLPDYEAAALVSIHADSCNIPGATGFKVARLTDSVIPEAGDRLVACLIQQYAVETGLPEHPASVTDGMTDYHAFNQISPFTPGAIIETGFLLDDQFLLVHKPKIVARGIAAGIICFLDGQPSQGE